MIFLGFILGSLLIGLVICDKQSHRISLAIVTFIVIIITVAIVANQTEHERTTDIIKEYQRGEIIEIISTQTLNDAIVSDTTYVQQKFKHKIK